MMKKDSPFKGKNALKKQKIYEILEDHIQLTSQEILSIVNRSMVWGLTMYQLSNILTRTKQFEKIGFSDTYDKFGKRYRCCVWGIKYE